MKFYMTPGSCSTAIHILLEEVESLFEVYLINLMAGDNRTPEYLALNPNGTIPTLITDDEIVLTDFESIAVWIANENPRYQLMPEDFSEQRLAIELMSYVVNTIHGQGFSRIFTTEKYSNDSAEHDGIKRQGQDIVSHGFSVIESILEDKDSLFKHFSIADAALFYVLFWADRINLPIPEFCMAYYQKLLKRPAIRQVLSEEGYGAMFVNHNVKMAV
jgi:glutathione S-transferase